MSGDYLWDGTGPPDPEVVRLETALRPLRRIPPPPAFGAWARRDWRPVWRALALAAAVLLALVPALTRTTRQPGPAGWSVAWVEDPSSPRADREDKLTVGRWLETGGDRATLAVGTIGAVRLEPRTRVGLVDGGRRAHQLSLVRGTLHATIWAQPGQFVVDTPSARAVDLGCEYTLSVDESGSGLLRVEAGWVGVEYHALQSLVPAGASCRLRPGRGPGTPRFETAHPALAEALDAFDTAASSGSAEAALDRVLLEARPRDALSLWHLLARADPVRRGRVFDKLATIVPAPPGVTRQGVVAGDHAMRDLWWDELGFGSAEFWREWTRSWRGGEAGFDPAIANTGR